MDVLDQYTEREIEDMALAARENGAKEESISRTWDAYNSGEISAGQAYARFKLMAHRPVGDQRFAYCVYSAAKGKRFGQPRSILNTDGSFTKNALTEAQRLSRNRGDLSRSEILRVLKKALREGDLVPASSSKKCAGRGDADYIDLMQLE